MRDRQRQAILNTLPPLDGLVDSSEARMFRATTAMTSRQLRRHMIDEHDLHVTNRGQERARWRWLLRDTHRNEHGCGADHAHEQADNG